MRLVMTEGTGRRVQLDGYTSAGKTGTTEKLINGRYSKDHHIGSFVGFAPADEWRKPELLAYVVVDNPVRMATTVRKPVHQWYSACCSLVWSTSRFTE